MLYVGAETYETSVAHPEDVKHRKSISNQNTRVEFI